MIAAPAIALLLLAAEAPAPPEGKKVCRPPEAQLGSHFKRPRICRTQAEWDSIEEARRGPALTTKAPQPESWERTRSQ